MKMNVKHPVFPLHCVDTYTGDGICKSTTTIKIAIDNFKALNIADCKKQVTVSSTGISFAARRKKYNKSFRCAYHI